MNLYSKPLNEYLCVMQFTLIICMCNFFKHWVENRYSGVAIDVGMFLWSNIATRLESMSAEIIQLSADLFC